MLLLYVSTEEQDADIFTKALSKCKFEFHRDRIGVTDLSCWEGVLKIATRNVKNRSAKNITNINSISGYIPILVSRWTKIEN